MQPVFSIPGYKRGLGFTLIELMVVVGILGIMMAIAVPLTMSYRATANLRGAASDIFSHLQSAKVNAIIPWAAVQTNTWVGGDPNPGTAIRVAGGTYTVERGYHFYKQVCRAGQAGMAVAKVRANDSELALIGFARNGTEHPDAFVVISDTQEVINYRIGNQPHW